MTTKRIGNIVLINAGVRVCGNCGKPEPDAAANCPYADAHNWSY